MNRIVIILYLLLALPAFAGDRSGKSVGLVLSGGGARGLAHIGVIRALEEQNVQIDAIAGTSMGAVVGALYASGRTPDELEAIALSIDWSQVLADLPARNHLSFRRKQDSRGNVVKAHVTLNDGVVSLPKGVIQGQNLQLTLQQLFLHVSSVENFDDLPIPFRAVASDLVTGEPHVFSQGSLATATRASLTIPGLFAPVEMDGRMLVDGGIANNLPVDVVKSMGVDVVIAVDIATPLYDADTLDSVLPIIEQLTTLLTARQAKRQYALITDDDLLITPDMRDISTADLENTQTIIQRGHQALSVFGPELVRFQSDVREVADTDFERPVIDRIRIVNSAEISDKLIKALIHQKIDTPFDEKQTRRDIESIYGYDYFESVRYNLVEEDGEKILEVIATGRSWGNDQLTLSMESFSDTRSESNYNLGAKFRKSGLTAKGGEWVSAFQIGQDSGAATELYLPLDYQQRWFLAPYISYQERTYNRITANTIESRFRIDQMIAGVFAGIEFDNVAVLGAGVERRDGDIKTYVGLGPAQQLFTDDSHYVLAEYDTLDNVSFPHSGNFTRIRYEHVQPNTASSETNILNISTTQAVPVLDSALVLKARYQRSSTPDIGRHRQQSLGGLLNLSGLHRDALFDSQLRYASISWIRRINQRRILPADFPVYIGLSLEGGNVWSNDDAVDLAELVTAGLVFLGVDTPVGPVYVGYGKAETDDSGFYIQLGHLF
jgi:NTE family protein